ncbi:MAG: hypothetical protein PHH22_04320 [Clostridia bacterium]|nr:hypothetical protein [Clostridia bacterium]
MKKLLTIILIIIFIITFAWTISISSDSIHLIECHDDCCKKCVMIHNADIYVKNTVTILFIVILFSSCRKLLDSINKNVRLVPILNSLIILKVRFNE